MRLTVLNDNNTIINNYLLGEPALSFYIEDGHEKILFDLGYSDVFIKNAYKLGINVNEVNKIIFSHGHDDHTGGLKYILNSSNINKKIIYSHPDAFYKKIENGLNIGSSYSLDELKKYFTVMATKKPVDITKKLIFLGEIPQYNNFEEKVPIGKKIKNGKIVIDYLEDDTAVVYKSEKGLLIITGCSHSGICNIVEHSKKVCGNEKVYGIIGGFHLFDEHSRIAKTVQYFNDNNVEVIYPCHCTSLLAKSMMLNKLKNIFEIGVGYQINMD